MQTENPDVLLDLEEEGEGDEDVDEEDGESGIIRGELVYKAEKLADHPLDSSYHLHLYQGSQPYLGKEAGLLGPFQFIHDQPNACIAHQADFDNKPDSLFFSDGKRRIDFVLVYEDETKVTHKRSNHKKQKRKRQVYESNLINNGLQLEATRSVLDEKIIFVKVHAPWEVLCTYAEVMHIKLPLQPNDLKTRESAFNWFTSLFRVDENIIKPEQEFFTAPFKREHLSNFYIQDKDTFFNPATRSRIVHFILSRVKYATKNNVKKFGINKLLDTGIYKAAFPLHDVSPELVVTVYLEIEVCRARKLCIFDSFGTLVFAVFMGIWVTLFLEFWKRRQAELEYEWDTVEYLEQEEQIRPEYEAQCTHVVVNEITQILLIIASVIGIIVYRLSVFLVFSATLPRHINGTQAIRKYLTPQTATSVTASIISFIVIMVLNIIYEKVAILITDFELPRTQTEYENSLTTKMFLFQFVNYYSSCFYIAFFKGKFVGYPGNPVYWLGKYRNEECDPGGCLFELTTQLAIIVGGKAIWNNIQEVLLPWIKNLIGRYCADARSEKIVPRWEQDYHLQPIGKLGLFYEYLEMVIQFGFVTLFVASFPLAPLLALINNMLEIRLDAWKLTTQFRRMVPQKAQDIGAWQPIMQGIAILAVVTNAMIIAFTSDMIPRLVYYWSFSVPPYGSHSSHTMKGYINNTLSVFNISDFKNASKPFSPWFGNHTTCRQVSNNHFFSQYRDFRYPPGHQHQYEHNIYYWHVIAAKLAFIIVMEHVIYFVKFIISYIIPDVSQETKSKVKREKYLTQKILHENDLKVVKKTIGKIADKIIEGVDSTFRPKTE
ncbi:UNVERIFIED_CONTAM: hypothetical protein H355_000256 [Colinus virginianus]|nr:hypothetical protein H355_000256 [Colinus virginianus]